MTPYYTEKNITIYHADWRDPTHYNLLIDSGVWGEEGAADLVTWALKQMPER